MRIPYDGGQGKGLYLDSKFCSQASIKLELCGYCYDMSRHGRSGAPLTIGRRVVILLHYLEVEEGEEGGSEFLVFLFKMKTVLGTWTGCERPARGHFSAGPEGAFLAEPGFGLCKGGEQSEAREGVRQSVPPCAATAAPQVSPGRVSASRI